MFHFKKFYFLSLLTFCPILSAQEISLEVGAGYRQDHLSWSLGGPEGRPSTLSRLEWSDLQITDYQAKVEATFCDKYYIRLEGDYGYIENGKNTDKDWTVDELTRQDLLYYATKAHAGKGTVWDVSVAGFSVAHCVWDCWQLRPLIGYSYHKQNLHFYNGTITIDAYFPELIGFKFRDLDSTYKASWNGPWAGFDLIYNGLCGWTFYTTQEIHALYYDAKGDWNLREDIPDGFSHRGWGWGYFGKLAAEYEFTCGWRFGAQFKYNYCRMNHGQDRTTMLVIEPGQEVIVVQTATRLKNIVWDSFSLLVTLGYTF